MPRDTVLFDINETCLDLTSLRPRFAAAFGDEGLTAIWFARLLHTSTVCALTGVSTTFAELAGHALDALSSARPGAPLSSEQRADIVGAFGRLPPHPDVPGALSRLRRAGYRTVAFTNSSLALVTSQLDSSGLAPHFDEVVSVEKTGSFKPDGTVYHYVARQLERAPHELRLIAAHDWDTHGAMVAGFHAGYIDRTGAPYHPLYRRPPLVARDLGALVEQVISADAAADSDEF